MMRFASGQMCLPVSFEPHFSHETRFDYGDIYRGELVMASVKWIKLEKNILEQNYVFFFGKNTDLFNITVYAMQYGNAFKWRTNSRKGFLKLVSTNPKAPVR